MRTSQFRALGQIFAYTFICSLLGTFPQKCSFRCSQWKWQNAPSHIIIIIIQKEWVYPSSSASALWINDTDWAIYEYTWMCWLYAILVCDNNSGMSVDDSNTAIDSCFLNKHAHTRKCHHPHTHTHIHARSPHHNRVVSRLVCRKQIMRVPHI